MHPPLVGGFNEILAVVAMGKGKGKQAVKDLQHAPKKPSIAIETPQTSVRASIVADAKKQKS
jgi:hypothetical protein